MNGIIQKLAEKADIDLSVDNIYEIQIFNSRNDISVYNNTFTGTAKLVLISGYTSTAYFYWGMGVFEVDKTYHTTTRTFFGEYHAEPKQETVTDIYVTNSDNMKAVNNRNDYMLACAIFLKS